MIDLRCAEFACPILGALPATAPPAVANRFGASRVGLPSPLLEALVHSIRCSRMLHLRSDRFSVTKCVI
jgi:hypothetical protein